MNVLVMSETLWPYGSGGELATFLYVKHLMETGIRVKVLVKDSRWSVEWRNLDVIRSGVLGTGKYSLPNYRFLKIFRKLIVWADVVYLAPASWYLIPLVKRLGKPVVVHLHSYDPVCPVGSLYNFNTNCTCIPECRTCRECIWLYERFHQRDLYQSIGSLMLNSLLGAYFAKFLGYADILIFVSNAHRDLFLRHLTYILDTVPKGYVTYNPVPEVHYIPSSEINVGYFGGLSPLKGYHILLEAWLRVSRKYPNVKLFATKMAKFAGSSILKRINVVAYDKLSPDELRKLLLRIGIIVFPSIWQEPLPYVVIESLLYGRLLITSQVGGVPEIVSGAPGVRLIPPANIEALVDALEWAISMDKRDLIELGLKNREYILKRFSNEESIRNLIKIFEKVVSSY